MTCKGNWIFPQVSLLHSYCYYFLLEHYRQTEFQPVVIVNKRSLPPTQPQYDPSMAWWHTKDALEGNHIILQWHRIHLVNPVSTVQLPSVDDHMSKHAKAYIIQNSLLHWTVSQDLWVTQVKEKTIMANLLLHYLHTYSMFIQGLSILCMAFHFTQPNHSIWSLDQLPSILQVHKLNPQSCTFGKTKKKSLLPFTTSN